MNELADFVLNTIRRTGGLVDSPAFEVYDVVLPEAVARRWQVPVYQRLTFAAPTPATGTNVDDATAVSYGHPLVEILVEEVRTETACMQVFVDNVRTDKRGLFSLARQALTFPNARLSPIPGQAERGAVCHYAHYNFKAALITDEKHEQLVSVLMDVQAGFAVPELEQIERLAQLVDKPSPGSHLPAPVRWLLGHSPLSGSVLRGLLERATDAALQELATPLGALHRRATRHLELDRARLNDYYDDIARDLQRRIDRASGASQDQLERRATLEDKLAVTQVERAEKLADVEAKYRPRVELELINLQFIHQPKVLLPVRIGTRLTTVERTVVWDPLLHRIEPLACDVCGKAATRLMLCNGNHLAHQDCLLPEQCVDCKRTYCRLCSGQMSRCVVCDRPVCVSSLNHCAECGQATCREHVGQCHAPSPSPTPEPSQEKPAPPAPLPPPSARAKVSKGPAPPPGKKKRKATKPAPRKAARPVRKVPAKLAASKIEVYIEFDTPVVNAFVLTKGNKQVAVRSWEWTGQEILVTCHCEKGYRCPAQGTILGPADDAGIEAQIRAQVESLRREYGLSLRRVLYYTPVHGTVKQVSRLTLPGEWKTKR